MQPTDFNSRSDAEFVAYVHATSIGYTDSEANVYAKGYTDAIYTDSYAGLPPNSERVWPNTDAYAGSYPYTIGDTVPGPRGGILESESRNVVSE